MLLKYIRTIISEPKLHLQEGTVSNISFYITTNNESMLIRPPESLHSYNVQCPISGFRIQSTEILRILFAFRW
jgi:hypothetical protein